MPAHTPEFGQRRCLQSTLTLREGMPNCPTQSTLADGVDAPTLHLYIYFNFTSTNDPIYACKESCSQKASKLLSKTELKRNSCPPPLTVTIPCKLINWLSRQVDCPQLIPRLLFICLPGQLSSSRNPSVPPSYVRASLICNREPNLLL